MMDIVERLVDEGVLQNVTGGYERYRPNNCLEAADEITRLRADNERLREALVPAPERLMELVDVVLHDMGEPTPPWSKQKLRVFYWGVARAALHHPRQDADG